MGSLYKTLRAQIDERVAKDQARKAQVLKIPAAIFLAVRDRFGAPLGLVELGCMAEYGDFVPSINSESVQSNEMDFAINFQIALDAGTVESYIVEITAVQQSDSALVKVGADVITVTPADETTSMLKVVDAILAALSLQVADRCNK